MNRKLSVHDCSEGRLPRRILGSPTRLGNLDNAVGVPRGRFRSLAQLLSHSPYEETALDGQNVTEEGPEKLAIESGPIRDA